MATLTKMLTVLPVSINRWRLFGLLSALYLAQGLPFGLLAKALPAVAKEAGLPTEYIGLLALPALPWALKFLWAPFVDRWGAGRAAHRKRWIVCCQLLAVAVLGVIATLSPQKLFGEHFVIFLFLLFLVNLCFATQDIASDGLAVRLLPVSLRGLGNSVQSGAYKTGLVVGGAMMLVLVELWGWWATFLLVMMLLLFLLLPVWRYQEPMEPPQHKESLGWRWWWSTFYRFWRRPYMRVWLLVLLGYKVGDSFGSRMIKPYLVDAGWSLTDIGVLDLISSLCGLLGAALAGLFLLRLGRRAALCGFGVLQGLSFFIWGYFVVPENSITVWYASLFEQLADGLSTVVLFTMMMDCCRAEHEGSDYTMQASMLLMSAGVFTLASGFNASWLGYQMHFILSAVLCLLAIIPVWWLRSWVAVARW